MSPEPNPPSDFSPICITCGAALEPQDADGLCLSCIAPSLRNSASPTPQRLSEFTPPTPEELGQDIEGYEVRKMLGKGGMGAVYLAYDPELDRLVAIKILPRQISASNPTAIARFTREARQMALLNHPHIVSVFQSGVTKSGEFFFVMEYVNGPTLWERVKQGPLAPAVALRIIGQVCSAIQAAHEKQIIHRDLTPSNILLDAAGNAKVADFGLAKLVDGESPTLTRTDQVGGTWGFSPPEQHSDFTHASPQTDIYALGAVFYFILTGRTPEGDWEAPTKQTPISRCIGRRIDQIIRKSLSHDPLKRPQSALAVHREIDRITQGKGSPQWLAIAAVVVAALIGGAAVLRHFRAQPTPLTPSVRVAPIASRSEPVAKPSGTYGDIQAKYRQRLQQVTDEAEFAFHQRRQEYIKALEQLDIRFKEAGNEGARQAVAHELDSTDPQRNDGGISKESDQFKADNAPLQPKAVVDLRNRFGTDTTQLLERRRSVRQREARDYAIELEALSTELRSKGKDSEARVAMLEAARARRGPEEILSKAGTVIGIGDERHNILNGFPTFGDDIIGVDSGRDHCLALTCDGRVIAWGLAECATPPAELSDVILMSAGVTHNLAMTADGKLHEWGVVDLGKGREPIGNRIPEIGEEVVSITAGQNFSAALGRSGKIHVWGVATADSADFSPPASVNQAVQLKAGRYRLLALRPDGGAVSWGVGGVTEHPLPGVVDSEMGKASQLPGIYLCTIGRQVLVIDTWPTGDDSAEIVRKHSKGLVQFADADELSVILKNDGTLVPFGATPDRARLEGMGSVVEIATGYLDNLLTVVEPKIPDSGRKITPPVTRKPWTGGVANKNSLDMEFLPVPGFEKILFSKWETRVSNYQQFAAAMLENPPPPIFSLSAEDWVQSENTWSSPGFDQTPDHPVVGVGFSDAKRFCNWLTCKEREAGLIPPEAEYRLPSDSEWAGMADLHEVGGTASVRIAMGEDSPLATSPADLAKIGNFAGDELKVLGLRVACLPNYSDPYPFTAPVTSQPEDARGFCGVFGNVWEICDDFHGADTQYRVVRGESWSSGAPLDGMMPSARLKMPPGGRRQDVGFRVVLDLGSNRARNRLIAQDLMDDLRLRNGIKPQYGTAKFEAHGLGIHFPGIPPLTDLSPLRGVPLTSLDIGQSSVSDLGPLQGAPLEDLDLKASKVADLSALRGAPLKFLNIDDTAVADLSPLADSPIENLSMENIPAKDFTPLAHMPLRKLYAFGTGLTDLSVLRGKRLILLSLHRTPVNDLSPLVGMPLQQLVLAGTEVTDLKPLQGMPLRTLVFHPQRIKNGLEVLLDLRDLEAVHIVPADADAKSKSRQLTRDQLHSAIRTGDWGWEK